MGFYFWNVGVRSSEGMLPRETIITGKILKAIA